MSGRTIVHAGRSVGAVARLATAAVLAAVLVIASSASGPTILLAHGPDPALGGNGWAAGQSIPYAWAAGQVPPSWLQDAFADATNQSNGTLHVRNPKFSLQSTAASLVAYGEPTGCSSAGIACFSRSAPTSFRIWYRAHGYWFDWGQLRWCQGPSGPVNGCFDAENIGLDELGHVQGLGHHVNDASGSDYLDAVVQAVSRARPKAGWDVHALGRCDIARLQVIYDRPSSWSPFSTCLAVSTRTGLSASASSVPIGNDVTFSATLATATSSSYGALSNDPVSGRMVSLERRFPGTATWTRVAGMAPAAGSGTYSVVIPVFVTYEWRATFATPTSEGLRGSASGTVTITATQCADCPYAVEP